MAPTAAHLDAPPCPRPSAGRSSARTVAALELSAGAAWAWFVAADLSRGVGHVQHRRRIGRTALPSRTATGEGELAVGRRTRIDSRATNRPGVLRQLRSASPAGLVRVLRCRAWP